jgi:hypothetical protein
VPYKDPERKRQWEREHRQERNGQRKKRRLDAQGRLSVLRQVPDPISVKETQSGWKLIVGLALAFGAMLLGAFMGTEIPARNQPPS